MSATVLVFD